MPLLSIPAQARSSLEVADRGGSVTPSLTTVPPAAAPATASPKPPKMLWSSTVTIGLELSY